LGVEVLSWLIPILLSSTPLIFTLTVVGLSYVSVDPELTPEELAKFEEAIAKSEWARALAKAMATTPEAQEMIARMLARSLLRGLR
jgi:hypothetical protein